MKMKKIAAMLGSGLALGLAAQAAQADALLFPYYQVGNGVYTFLSLTSWSGSGGSNMHYIWEYKNNPTDLTAACIHEDAYGALTARDIMQQTVEDPSVPGGNHLNLKTTFGDASTPAYSLTAPATGFIIVNNPGDAEGNFSGQAIVVDATSGTVAAYKGVNNPGSTVEGTWNSVFTSKAGFDMTWYPTTETGSTLGASGVNTSWYLVVTGVGMSAMPGWAGTGVLQNADINGFVWNRDEVPRSGLVPQTVNCYGQITRTNILTAAQRVHTANGGYTWQSFTPTLNGASGAMMTKIESTTALGRAYTFVSTENSVPNMPY